MIQICDCFLYDYSELPRSENIRRIARNTANTWQAGRSLEEKSADTGLGKLAEAAVEKYINESLSGIVFLPYDKLRTDNFQKHAPFDGLLYAAGNSAVDNMKKKINSEVAISKCGKISGSLRKQLKGCGILTAEIKSTRVNDKKKEHSKFTAYSDPEQTQRLIGEICKDDFLTYPLFTRTGDHTWGSYCKAFANKIGAEKLSDSACCDAMKERELSAMDDIYIRVYVDEKLQKVIIIGFITAEMLLDPPCIKKMPRYNKSENALYFAKALSARLTMDNLSEYIR